MRRPFGGGAARLLALSALSAMTSIAACASKGVTNPCGDLADCGVCVPLAFDAHNCGACGNVCARDKACVHGVCLAPGADAAHDGGPGSSAGASGGGGASALAAGGALTGSAGVGAAGAAAAGSAGTVGGSGGGAGGSGPACAAPRTLCGASCVDVAKDPLHCGSCEAACAEGVCQLGVCSAFAIGHEVLFGMDFAKVPGNHVGERRMLANAAFLGATSGSGTWRILGYDAHASPTVPAIDGMLHLEAASHGVTDLTIVHVVSVTAMLETLAPAHANAVVFYDQPKAVAGALSDLGAALAGALDAFTRAGGIVIVLSGGSGPNEMWALAVEAALFPTTGFHPLGAGAALDGAAPLDALSVGVATPIAAPVHAGTWELAAGGTWDVVLRDHATQGPVVVHRAVVP